MTTKTPAVEVAPLHTSGELTGFLLVGRWPDSTLEWLRVLALAVRVAAIPGMLSASTVFRAHENVPTEPAVGAVGALLAEGPVGSVGGSVEGFVGGGRAGAGGGAGAGRAGSGASGADAVPAALMVLHPPAETIPSIPEVADVASGCVLLPGLPHLGLEHRAGWIEACGDGMVTSMTSRHGLDLQADVDTAVLATLLAA